MKLNAFIVTFLAFAALMPANNASAQILRLKANPTVLGEQITIGDVFENAGDKSGLPLARAPINRQKLVFSKDSLQAKINSMGLKWNNDEGVKQVTIIGKDGGDENQNPSSQVKVSNILGQEIAVLNRNVNRDEIINAEMISWISAPSNLPNDAVINAENIIGKSAAHLIRANAAIRVNDLTQAKAIKRGQNITLIYEMSGIRITLKGRALNDGYSGSTIKVTNIDSNRILEAIVQEDGTGQIIMPSSNSQISASLN